MLFPHATIFSRWKNLYQTLFSYHAGAINGAKSLIYQHWRPNGLNSSYEADVHDAPSRCKTQYQLLL